MRLAQWILFKMTSQDVSRDNVFHFEILILNSETMFKDLIMVRDNVEREGTEVQLTKIGIKGGNSYQTNEEVFK